MTINDRLLLDLSDLKSIRFECLNCGTVTAIETSKWQKVPSTCSICGAEWYFPSHESGPYAAVNRLRLALLNLVNEEERNWRIRFEVDRNG